MILNISVKNSMRNYYVILGAFIHEGDGRGKENALEDIKHRGWKRKSKFYEEE